MEASNAVHPSLVGSASLPNKPIVSDMTVSSRGEESESASKEESRDERSSRLYDEEESREGEKEDGKKLHRSKGSPPKSMANVKSKPASSASTTNIGGRYQYPHGNGMGQPQPPRSAPFPMGRGPYGPPPYFPGSGAYGGPPHHGHPPHPPFHPGGPPIPHHAHHHPHHGHHPMMQPPHYQGGYAMGQGNSYQPHHHPHGPPPPYGGPYTMPPFHGMPPSYMPSTNIVTNMSTDSISISSSRSKSSRNSSKKRTIETVASAGPLPAAYSFRRTDSASSSTSTVTAGNNTNAEASPQKHKHLDDDHVPQQRRYHRRDYSGTSTASSLSVGGYSLASYEGPRVGATEDSIMMDAPLLTNSPKRRKGDDREPLLVDTDMRPQSVSSHSVDADHSSRFEQLSIDASKLPPSTSSASSAGHDRNLFLSLSTSPINNDVDATPISKNTAKQKKVEGNKAGLKKASIFKPKIDTSAPPVADRPSDTPTPPVHGELGSSMTDEHSMLNNHLRNQSFTPLHHLTATESSGNSPSNAAFASAIQPQLSWSIAGDTPSLGDLAEWEEEHKISNKAVKDDQKTRPSSTTSTDTRNMMISPHDFQFWKEDHDNDIIESSGPGISGTTTPLPVFFGQSSGDGSENHLKMDHSKKAGEPEHIHHMFMNNMRPGVHGAGLKPSNKPMPHPIWSKHHDPSGMPPTPVFHGSHGSEYRDDCFGPRSPMGGDRRDMDFYQFSHLGPHAHNDRVRNLRGRLPPGGHMPPMPIHIPPHMSAHLPMTSPMGLGHKAGLWSPHHPGMPPPLGSPTHMGSPLSIMAQSRRKCVPLKPPIPSKFQGDMDKSKAALVPEFTNLVNFPGHMSQKQSVNLPEGMRCCVMCGQACPCTSGTKCKKSKKPSGSEGGGGLMARSSNTSQDQLGDKNSGFAIIPTQNKGLCTLCDVNVWVVVTSGLEIKWCKGCKNFRPWAAFGDKGLATKCLRCRERQREKYALQKEEKEKTRIPSKTMTKSK